MTGHLAALFFVDDTDLIHINLKSEETVTVSHQAMQDSISNWGQILIASGGHSNHPSVFTTLYPSAGTLTGAGHMKRMRMWKTSI